MLKMSTKAKYLIKLSIEIGRKNCLAVDLELTRCPLLSMNVTFFGRSQINNKSK